MVYIIDESGGVKHPKPIPTPTPSAPEPEDSWYWQWLYYHNLELAKQGTATPAPVPQVATEDQRRFVACLEALQPLRQCHRLQPLLQYCQQS